MKRKIIKRCYNLSPLVLLGVIFCGENMLLAIIIFSIGLLLSLPELILTFKEIVLNEATESEVKVCGNCGIRECEKLYRWCPKCLEYNGIIKQTPRAIMKP
jgi:hypothetical protein